MRDSQNRGRGLVLDKSDIQETLVSLYLRLNGYFVSGFIVHAAWRAGTEIDVLAIRFPWQKEPAREVLPDDRLGISAGHVDFIIGEVKGGQGNVNFNIGFRGEEAAVRSVLERFGAFSDDEMDRVCGLVPKILEPRSLQRQLSFPELEVVLGDAAGKQKGILRFVPFAAEQRRSNGPSRPYIFEDDLLGFIWKCFRPDKPRGDCDVRYNFELWGPQFVELVRYFKDRSRDRPGTIEDIYRTYGV